MNITDFIKNNIVILDGAMGTMLQKQGLMPGELTEMWNISYPDKVTDVHKQYFDAGSNIVLTNTFGANRLHFSPDEAERIIAAGIENAKKAAQLSTGSQDKFVAFDIGPSGQVLKPLGDMDFEEAVGIFSEMVRSAEKYKPDLYMIETMSDSYETKAALLAVKENSDLPVFVSNAYSENNKLMTGADALCMVSMLEGMGADAVGVNCSFGPDKLYPVVKDYLKYASVPVLLKPNAGMPRTINSETVYDIDEAHFAKIIKELVAQGVRIAGGCCGTSPEYIRAVSEILKYQTLESADKNGASESSAQNITIEQKENNLTVVSSYSKTAVFSDDPLLIGERINPTGKKRFKQALVDKDMSYILEEAIKQQDAGAHILDVNVGLPQIDEPEMISSVVYEIQGVTDLPLQIDTSDPEAMERALRIYNGKALINSVNGKEESMKSIFPLVKKYGGVVVALTLDENGIPETVEGRVKIAEKILNRASEYGIKKKDIIFDTLTMAAGTDPRAASITLGAMKMIRENLGCYTVLGVSNISFGLPERNIINSAFYMAALESGLSSAIMNPFSAEMMKTYHAYRALHGLDKNCADYIGFVQTLENMRASAGRNPENMCDSSGKTLVDNHISASDNRVKSSSETDSESLYALVRKGLKEKAAETTEKLLEKREPLDLVKDEIVPALDAVGVEYEEGRAFLPQLLMSAQAAQKAFEQIKIKMPAGQGGGKCDFVLATVKGDIHDIGKNIVKLLLENYGFRVSDLGKDVAPDVIVEEIIRLHAPVAGLSALMTTTVPAMAETVKLIHEKTPWCKVVVGGAVMNQEYADSMGADKYCRDAMDTVRYAEEIDSINNQDTK